jgi:predicted nucleotidyltransferase
MKRSAVRESGRPLSRREPRVFGSVLHGTDRDGSDLDLLVDACPVPRCWTWAIWKKN